MEDVEWKPRKNPKDHCPRGHPYVEGSFRWHMDGKGYVSRRCIECSRAIAKEWREKRKAQKVHA